jgi:3-phenylpropionate/trans-cinnamate dioxygenase ferredoxin component
MSFVEVTQVDQVAPGTMKSFTVGDKQVLIANCAGTFYAIANACTHMGGDLSHGKLEGTVVICPRHGAHFELTTGKCIAGPKIGPLQLKTSSTVTYPVQVEGNAVRVQAG